YIELEKDIQQLYNVLPKRKWKGIIGVARGAVYPALFLAHKLKIHNMETISLTSYGDDEKQGELTLLNEFNFNNKEEGEGWLVVDDLTDSGRTLNWIKKRLPKAYYAVIYTN